MSLFSAAVLVAAALVGLGITGMLRRRSLIGVVIGFEVALAGVLLLAITLFTLSGFESSMALVATMVLAALAMASAVLVAGVHLAMSRAAGTERGLEPW